MESVSSAEVSPDKDIEAASSRIASLKKKLGTVPASTLMADDNTSVRQSNASSYTQEEEEVDIADGSSGNVMSDIHGSISSLASFAPTSQLDYDDDDDEEDISEELSRASMASMKDEDLSRSRTPTIKPSAMPGKQEPVVSNAFTQEALQRIVKAKDYELQQLTQKLQKMEEILEFKQVELGEVKRDLETLGEKLIDEIEKRAELQHSKDTVQDELEELTKSLFEEANSMVANEARRRHEYQEREQSIHQELQATKLDLQQEQALVAELRARLESAEEQNERCIQVMQKYNIHHKDYSHSISRKTLAEPPIDALIDAVLYSQFDAFLKAVVKTKMAKLHSLTFMRNCLDDDVIPCLRFGGNPRTSSKKLVDAIMLGSCVVEELSDGLLMQLKAKHRQKQQEAQQTASPGEKTGSELQRLSTGSQALFNKTVLERLSNALANANIPALSASSSSDVPAQLTAFGCSACGKEEDSHYRFRISEITSEDNWNFACGVCRDRLAAVCDFYKFIRNMRQGIYINRKTHELYMESLLLRRNMFYARIAAQQYAFKDDLFKKIMRMPRTVGSPHSIPLSAMSSGPESALVDSPYRTPLSGGVPLTATPTNERSFEILIPGKSRFVSTSNSLSQDVGSSNSDVPLYHIQKKLMSKPTSPLVNNEQPSKLLNEATGNCAKAVEGDENPASHSRVSTETASPPAKERRSSQHGPENEPLMGSDEQN